MSRPKSTPAVVFVARLVLVVLAVSLVGSSAAHAQRVEPDERNIASHLLPGTWEFDEGLTERLGGPEPSTVRAKITPDPTATVDVPERFRERLSALRVVQAGRLEADLVGGRAVTMPYLLATLSGTTYMLLVTSGPDGEPAADVRAFVVMFAAGSERMEDLLFLADQRARGTVAMKRTAVFAGTGEGPKEGPGTRPGPGDRPPGHDGPVPSADGQAALRALVGLTFADARGREWTIGPFGVIPNPASPGGKGPVVMIRNEGGDGEVRHVPVETDADVAALYRLATGEDHATLGGAPGETHRRAMAALDEE